MKRSRLRAAVVATISLSPLGLAGCGPSVTSTAQVVCPAEAPTDGAACAGVGSCRYGACMEREATCEQGVWKTSTVSSCNPPPPPPVCPELVPVEGEGCLDPLECDYVVGCDLVSASCDQVTASWTLTSTPDPLCNPPPPCPTSLPAEGSACELELSCVVAVPSACGDLMATATCAPAADGALAWAVDVPECTEPVDCATLLEPVACELHAVCRWLVPGCDPGGAPFSAGCYPRRRLRRLRRRRGVHAREPRPLLEQRLRSVRSARLDLPARLTSPTRARGAARLLARRPWALSRGASPPRQPGLGHRSQPACLEPRRARREQGVVALRRGLGARRLVGIP